MAFQGALKVKQELLWSKETKEQKETMDRDGDEGVSQMAPGNRSTLSAENTLVRGTSLMAQRAKTLCSTAGDAGSIPGQGTKIPHATRGSQKQQQQTRTLWSCQDRRGPPR